MKILNVFILEVGKWLVMMKNDTCVICCHGIRSDKNEFGNFNKLSQKLQENGVSCYCFDFTGHGEDDKDFSEFNISTAIKDLELAMDYVNELGYEKIIVLGASFGAGIVGLMDYRKYPNVVALILWYPALVYSDAEMFSQNNVEKAMKNGFLETESMNTGKIYNFSKKLMMETREYSPYDTMLKCDLPKLFIHGNKDTVVPCSRTKSLAEESKNSEIVIIENGTHGFFDNEQHLNEMINCTIDYVKKMSN